METAYLVAQAARPESSGTLAEASECLPWPLQAASPAATLKKECCQSYYFLYRIECVIYVHTSLSATYSFRPCSPAAHRFQ
jgi:hypothetical protein